MAITFEEVKERLKRLDEITLLEVLNLNSEVIVDRFEDIIEENIETLAREFEDEQELDAEGVEE